MISTELYVLLSSILSFGAPMAIAVYSVWAMDRPRPGDSRRRSEADTPPLTPTDGELPPLPDCLVPKLDPVASKPAPAERQRVLEPA